MMINTLRWLDLSKRSVALLMNPPRTSRHFRHLSTLVVAGVLSLSAHAHAQTRLLDLTASNYNNTTGVWSDPTSGNSATGPAGALVTNSTPNGSSAVGFNGTSTTFSLATTIPLTGGSVFTIFVFTEPTVYTYGAFISGGDNSLEYRINTNGTQTVNRTSEAGDGNSGTALTLGAYNNVNVQIALTGGTGGTFRLNGSADGTTTGDGNITNSLTNIGSQDNGSEKFEGNIAEIEVYSGIMTDAQRAGVEANFTAEYVTVGGVPEPGTWAMALIGVGALLGVQRFRPRTA